MMGQSLDSPRWRIMMAVGALTILRFLRDLSNVASPKATSTLYFFFVIASCAVLLANALHIEDLQHRNPGLLVCTQPVLAGMLAAATHIFRVPFDASYTWTHDIVWWFWTAYLVERK